MKIQASAFLGTSPIRQFAKRTLDRILVQQKSGDLCCDNDIPVCLLQDTTRSKPDEIKVYLERLNWVRIESVFVIRVATS